MTLNTMLYSYVHNEEVYESMPINDFRAEVVMLNCVTDTAYLSFIIKTKPLHYALSKTTP